MRHAPPRTGVVRGLTPHSWPVRNLLPAYRPSSDWGLSSKHRDLCRDKAGNYGYPFRAPNVRPLVMYFSRAMPAVTTGITLTNEIALMFHHSV